MLLRPTRFAPTYLTWLAVALRLSHVRLTLLDHVSFLPAGYANRPGAPLPHTHCPGSMKTTAAPPNRNGSEMLRGGSAYSLPPCCLLWLRGKCTGSLGLVGPCTPTPTPTRRPHTS